MHDAEARALKRAVVVLLVVSSVRWAWARPEPPPTADGNVLDELLEESRVAATEEQRRAEPLADGERIDPNRADEIQLDRLPGVGPATARAIVGARDSGIVFRRPEDLVAVRGIGPATVGRLANLLDLDSPPPAIRSRASARGGGVPSGHPPVDINRAGTDELQRLPGIGAALAERIAEERTKRMFMSVDDLVRVPGIGPATVERLRGAARVGGAR
ncbi:MAG: helix-hairpin-helix domain-containing protein [Gemmatimonadota bacterium]